MNSPAHTRQFGTPQEQEELARRLNPPPPPLPLPLTEYEIVNPRPPEWGPLDQSEGFKTFTTEDGEQWAFNESQLRGEDPLPLEVQNTVLRGHDGTELNTSDGTFHFEGPPPDAEGDGDGDGLEMPDYDPDWVAQFGSPEQKAAMARDLKAQEQETKNIEMTSYDYDPNYGKGLTRGDVRKREGDDGEGTWYAISKHDDDEPYDTSPYTAPSRMIRDNPDIKRFHPDYGGVPGKGVPKKQWYGTGNHPLNR